MKSYCRKSLLSLLFFSVFSHTVTATPLPPKTTWENMWEIQLINNDNLIFEDISMDFMVFDGQQVDARAGMYYAQMEEAAAQDGITLYLRSGFRSIATQRTLYNAGVSRYMSTYGYSYSTAVSIANRYYAQPGGSEHHLGLGFDIITPHYHQTVYNLTSAFGQTEAYYWLIANCADYGFILRYPEGRTAETGINFEPWHYRYVGVAHAQYITEHQLLLEEYVALYQATYPELYSDTPPVYEDVTVEEMEDDDFHLTFRWDRATWAYSQLEVVFKDMLPELASIQQRMERIALEK